MPADPFLQPSLCTKPPKTHHKSPRSDLPRIRSPFFSVRYLLTASYSCQSSQTPPNLDGRGRLRNAGGCHKTCSLWLEVEGTEGSAVAAFCSGACLLVVQFGERDAGNFGGRACLSPARGDLRGVQPIFQCKHGVRAEPQKSKCHNQHQRATLCSARWRGLH